MQTESATLTLARGSGGGAKHARRQPCVDLLQDPPRGQPDLRGVEQPLPERDAFLGPVPLLLGTVDLGINITQLTEMQTRLAQFG